MIKANGKQMLEVAKRDGWKSLYVLFDDISASVEEMESLLIEYGMAEDDPQEVFIDTEEQIIYRIDTRETIGYYSIHATAEQINSLLEDHHIYIDDEQTAINVWNELINVYYIRPLSMAEILESGKKKRYIIYTEEYQQ